MGASNYNNTHADYVLHSAVPSTVEYDITNDISKSFVTMTQTSALPALSDTVTSGEWVLNE